MTTRMTRAQLIAARRPQPTPAEPLAGMAAMVGPTTFTVSLQRQLILLGCVAGKRSLPAPAADLYTSQLWRKRRAYAEATGMPWLILSAEHGLLHPSVVIDPYDTTLGSSRAAARAWTELVAGNIINTARAAGITRLEIHAGSRYTPTELLEELALAGLEVQLPLRGMGIGDQLAWYTRREEAPK